MTEEDLKPLREYYEIKNPQKRIVLMNVDYNNKLATVFHKENQSIEIKDFDWCQNNLVLLNEFNK
jgi:hypothetical protein|tara:strand:+ start:1728 stop:1922 length:195 start_codon:yes stop_codon:yes gene_type:complete